MLEIRSVWQLYNNDLTENTMTRPIFKLTKDQQSIISRTTKRWHGGDDNDFSCWLSSIKMDAYKAGLFDYAYHIHRNDPLALDVTRDIFLVVLESRLESDKEWETIHKAHALSVDQSG